MRTPERKISSSSCAITSRTWSSLSSSPGFSAAGKEPRRASGSSKASHAWPAPQDPDGSRATGGKGPLDALGGTARGLSVLPAHRRRRPRARTGDREIPNESDRGDAPAGSERGRTRASDRVAHLRRVRTNRGSHPLRRYWSRATGADGWHLLAPPDTRGDSARLLHSTKRRLSSN